MADCPPLNTPLVITCVCRLSAFRLSLCYLYQNSGASICKRYIVVGAQVKLLTAVTTLSVAV